MHLDIRWKACQLPGLALIEGFMDGSSKPLGRAGEGALFPSLVAGGRRAESATAETEVSGNDQ